MATRQTLTHACRMDVYHDVLCRAHGRRLDPCPPLMCVCSRLCHLLILPLCRPSLSLTTLASVVTSRNTRNTRSTRRLHMGCHISSEVWRWANWQIWCCGNRHSLVRETEATPRGRPVAAHGMIMRTVAAVRYFTRYALLAGSKPESVLKSGVIVWAQMGDANASIPTPEPVLMRPMYGAHGRAASALSVAFVSQVSIQQHTLDNQQSIGGKPKEGEGEGEAEGEPDNMDMALVYVLLMCCFRRASRPLFVASVSCVACAVCSWLSCSDEILDAAELISTIHHRRS